MTTRVVTLWDYGTEHQSCPTVLMSPVGIDLEATRLCYNLCGRNLNIQRGDMTKGDKEVDRKHTVLDILSLLSLLSLVSYSLLSSFNHHYCLFNIYSRHPVFVADSKLLIYRLLVL
ncbi:hypothetical protein BRARA_J00160 [Brassica rapa]|uniref:Uncharacterized protein n=1 Tax=Brassica campestris TaxID=3711 RepID=A0A397XQ10_BRACM|nr:hypothetical protein BRARA_J00160 [Brassica rapa]